MAITDSKRALIQKRGYPTNIVGDQYDLYLSNYTLAAQYLAKRIGNQSKTYAELCCGIGVTLMIMAAQFQKSFGVDIDKKVLKFCQQNLQKAGVLEKVTLLQRDLCDKNIFNEIKADIVVYDIPYWVSKKLSDGTDVLSKNPPFKDVIKNIRKNITGDFIVFAPPYFEYTEIKQKFGKCEFQKVIINGRYDRNYIYFGNLIKTEGITEIHL